MAASASARLTSGAMSNSRGAPDPHCLQGLAEARAASAQALEADHKVSLAAHAGASAGGGSRLGGGRLGVPDGLPPSSGARPAGGVGGAFHDRKRHRLPRGCATAGGASAWSRLGGLEVVG